MSMDIEKIKAKIESIPEGYFDVVARVGWFPSAKYPDNTPVAYVAAIQEYGYAAIPTRMPIRSTVAARKAAWAKLMQQGVKESIKGNLTAYDVLDAVGLQVAGDIRKAVTEVSGPPLSPVTLLLRKWRLEGKTITGKTVGEAVAAIAAGADYSSAPTDILQDTGLLIATLNHIVAPSGSE